MQSINLQRLWKSVGECVYVMNIIRRTWVYIFWVN